MATTRDTARQSANASSPLDADQKLSSASAALSLRQANPRDLPSFPSIGIANPQSSAGAAASLAAAQKRTVELWQPTPSDPANKAAYLARDYRAAPLWQPDGTSAAGSKAALLAHRGQTAGPLRKSNSAKTPAEAQRQASSSGSAQPRLSVDAPASDLRKSASTASTGRPKALKAAKGAIVVSRQRADSVPVEKARYPDAANASANALRAATKANASDLRSTPAYPNDLPSLSLQDATRIHKAAVTNMSREMYTSTPPVALEQDERNRQAGLRAAAVSMAKTMYDVQHKVGGDSGSESRSAATASARHRPSSSWDSRTSTSAEVSTLAAQYGNLQETARRLASERLAKLTDEGAEYRSYYGTTSSDTPRSRLSLRGRRRASSDGLLAVAPSDAASDEARSRKIRQEMSLFSNKLAEVDATKRQRDRDSLLAAAKRNVARDLHGIDEKVYADTGKVTPAMRASWETKAREKAEEDSKTRMANHGRVDIGGGKFMDQSAVEAIAATRVQPTLDDITRRAEEQRAEDERRRQEAEDLKRLEEEKKADDREREAKTKAEWDKFKAEEKREKEAREAEAKQEREEEQWKRNAASWAKKDEREAQQQETKLQNLKIKESWKRFKDEEKREQQLKKAEEKRQREEQHQAARAREQALKEEERARKLEERQNNADKRKSRLGGSLAAMAAAIGVDKDKDKDKEKDKSKSADDKHADLTDKAAKDSGAKSKVEDSRRSHDGGRISKSDISAPIAIEALPSPTHAKSAHTDDAGAADADAESVAVPASTSNSATDPVSSLKSSGSLSRRDPASRGATVMPTLSIPTQSKADSKRSSPISPATEPTAASPATPKDKESISSPKGKDLENSPKDKESAGSPKDKDTASSPKDKEQGKVGAWLKSRFTRKDSTRQAKSEEDVPRRRTSKLLKHIDRRSTVGQDAPKAEDKDLAALNEGTSEEHATTNVPPTEAVTPTTALAAAGLAGTGAVAAAAVAHDHDYASHEGSSKADVSATNDKTPTTQPLSKNTATSQPSSKDSPAAATTDPSKADLEASSTLDKQSSRLSSFAPGEPSSLREVALAGVSDAPNTNSAGVASTSASDHAVTAALTPTLDHAAAADPISAKHATTTTTTTQPGRSANSARSVSHSTSISSLSSDAPTGVDPHPPSQASHAPEHAKEAVLADPDVSAGLGPEQTKSSNTKDSRAVGSDSLGPDHTSQRDSLQASHAGGPSTSAATMSDGDGTDHFEEAHDRLEVEDPAPSSTSPAKPDNSPTSPLSGKAGGDGRLDSPHRETRFKEEL